MNIRHATMNDQEAIAHTDGISYPKFEGAMTDELLRIVGYDPGKDFFLNSQMLK